MRSYYLEPGKQCELCIDPIDKPHEMPDGSKRWRACPNAATRRVVQDSGRPLWVCEECFQKNVKSLDELLERPYSPPPLYVLEEVELGGGYHTLSVCSGPERDWFGPYKKSGCAEYVSRVVKVEYPPKLERPCQKESSSLV